MSRQSYEYETFTSLDAVIATGTGDEVGFVKRPGHLIPSRFTWTIATTGAPVSFTANLEGCIGDPDVVANWFVIDIATAVGMRHVVNKVVDYLRINLDALAGGVNPTVTGLIFAE